MPALLLTILSILLLFTSPLQAAERGSLRLGSPESITELTSRLLFQEAKANQKAPSLADEDWHPLPPISWHDPDYPSFWVKLKLASLSAESMTLYSNLSGGYVDLYRLEPHSGSLQKVAQGGTLLPQSERTNATMIGHSYLMPHQLGPKEQKVFLWKIDKGEITPFSPNLGRDPLLAPLSHFEEAADHRRMAEFALMAVLLSLFAYHMVLYFFGGERYYLIFSVNCIGILWLQAYFLGLHFEFFLKESPRFAYGEFGILSVMAWNLGILWFSHELLQTKVHLHSWAKWFKPPLVLTLVFLSFGSLVWFSTYALAAFVQIGVLAGLFAMGIAALRAKAPNAKIYLWANSAFYAGFIYDISIFMFPSFNHLHLLPIAEGGILMQQILFALALALNLKRLQIERDEAQTKALKAQTALIETSKNYSRDLELEVSKRTEELRIANEAKDRFFSIISHDLKGPIGSMAVLFNDVITRGSDIDTELFHGMRRSTRHLQRLLEDLLTWARSQNGMIEFHPQDFLIQEILQENLGLLKGQAEQKGIELSIVETQPLYVYADPSMVTTVLRNLISNAIKFTPRGGKVTLSAMEHEGGIEVAIQDTGQGISPQDKRKLFQLGEKIHSKQGTNEETGTGLGLIICKDFIERNQGEIGVQSSPGQGSRFWFTLPKGEKSEDLQGRIREKIADWQFLLVEEDPLYQEAALKTLAQFTKRVDTAKSQEESLDLTNQNRYDLILMDLDGHEGFLRLFEHIQGEIVPKPILIALSSFTKEKLQKENPTAQFDGFLNKPLDQRSLNQALRPLVI